MATMNGRDANPDQIKCCNSWVNYPTRGHSTTCPECKSIFTLTQTPPADTENRALKFGSTYQETVQLLLDHGLSQSMALVLIDESDRYGDSVRTRGLIVHKIDTDQYEIRRPL